MFEAKVKSLSKERQKLKDKNSLRRLMEATGADRKGMLATITDETTIGEHVNIKLSYLKDYPEHTYTIYNDEELKALADDIKLNGLLQPLLIWHYNNEYIILSGHNRKRACELAGLKTADCIVKHNITPEEATIIVHATNMQQRGFESLSLYDKCRSIMQVRKATKKLYEENKERFGIDSVKGFDCGKEVSQYYKLKSRQIAIYIKVGETLKKEWYEIVPKVINLKLAYAICLLDLKLCKKIFEYVYDQFQEGKKVKINDALLKDIKKMSEEGIEDDEIITYLEKPKKVKKGKNKQFVIDFSNEAYEPFYDKIQSLDQEKLKYIIIGALQKYIRTV